LTINNSTAAATVTQLVPASTLSITGPVKITNQTGADTAVFGIAGTAGTLDSGLTLLHGHGASATTFSGLAVSITGDVSVSNSNGSAFFDASGSDQLGISGNLTIQTSGATSALILGGGTQGFIGGTLTYTSGTGGDAIAMTLMDLH